MKLSVKKGELPFFYRLVTPQAGFARVKRHENRSEDMLVLEELKRSLAPYKAKLNEMGNSL